MAAPSTIFDWATAGGANKTAVPSALRSTGFIDGTTARADYVNQALNEIGQWIVYLEPFVPTDGVLEAQGLRGDGTNDLTISSEGQDLVLYDSLGGDISMIFDDSAGKLQWNATNGTEVLTGSLTVDNGVVVDRNLTSGYRYAYGATSGADPLTLEYSVNPAHGGWVGMGDPTQDLYMHVAAVTDVTATIASSGSAGSTFARYKLPLPKNNEAVTAGTEVYSLEDLTARLDVNDANVDVTARIVQVNRGGSGSKTTLLTVTQSGIGDTEQSDTSSNTLNPETYDYFVEVFADASAGVGAGSVAFIKYIRYTLDKSAVE